MDYSEDILVTFTEYDVGTVRVGGVDLTKIVRHRGVQVDISTGRPIVTVALMPANFELDLKGEFRIALSDLEREALAAAGWTPPKVREP